METKFKTRIRHGRVVTILHNDIPIETLRFQEDDEWQGFIFDGNEYDIHYLLDEEELSTDIYLYKDGKTFTNNCLTQK